MIHIFLPVKNESKFIEDTAMRLHLWCSINFPNNFKIVFIDDNSTDATFHKLYSLILKDLEVIGNPNSGGKGSALKYGFLRRHWRCHSRDLILFLDGDGQIEFDDILVGSKLMDIYNADAVIGNKRHQFSQTKYGLLRSIVSMTYNLLVRTLFQINFEDTQCGLKIFRKYALVAVIDNIDRGGFAFDIDLLVALKKNKFRIIDCPVKVNKQMNSGSISFKNIFNTFLK